MTLEDLLYYVNDGTTINLYNNFNFELINAYDPSEIPERYLECEVTDIFGDKDLGLGIEINTDVDDD